jgi:hypothetical protein
MDPRAGLDDVEKGKFLTLPGLEHRPFGRPARSQSLYRLCWVIEGKFYSKTELNIIRKMLEISCLISRICEILRNNLKCVEFKSEYRKIRTSYIHRREAKRGRHRCLSEAYGGGGGVYEYGVEEPLPQRVVLCCMLSGARSSVADTFVVSEFENTFH